MTKTTRNLVGGIALVAMVAGPARMARASEGEEAGVEAAASPSTSRVRPGTPALVALVREAIQRSATFRALVKTIDASDGIVYIEAGTCPRRGVRACLVGVQSAGPHRLLLVRVDPQKADWDLMGSIGHELQHAIEVLDNPTVTSTRAMYFFYRREGSRIRATFETTAAIEAGDAVRAEVRQAPRS